MKTVNCPACGGPSSEALHQYDSGLAIRRCSDCGFAYTSPRLTMRELDGIYQSSYFGGQRPGLSLDYLQKAPLFKLDAEERVAILMKWLPRGSSVLEIGSAAGFFLRACMDRGYSAYGVEISSEMCEYSKKELGAPCANCNLDDFEAKENYDAVALWHSLEHMEEPLQSLSKIHAILKPGGVLFVTVPNIESGNARRLGREWHHLQPEMHLSHFSRASLGGILAKTRFSLVEMWKSASTGFFKFGAQGGGLKRLIASNLGFLGFVRKPIKHLLVNCLGRDDFITAVARRND